MAVQKKAMRPGLQMTFALYVVPWHREENFIALPGAGMKMVGMTLTGRKVLMAARLLPSSSQACDTL